MKRGICLAESPLAGGKVFRHPLRLESSSIAGKVTSRHTRLRVPAAGKSLEESRHRSISCRFMRIRCNLLPLEALDKMTLGELSQRRSASARRTEGLS